jgi:S-formylglutathione hydrolase FrmB
MALCKINYDSTAMGQKMGVCVIIPENKWGHSLADRPQDYVYPTLWLLCGGGYDHTDWLRYTALELYAAKRGIAVVLPGVSYSGYVNTAEGDYRWWDQIAYELPAYLRKVFPLSLKREDNFVAGFSMGGYGAFKLAMQRPEMFAACGNFSGPVGIIPREPIPSDEKLGQPCLRDDFCEPQFSTLWASFGSAKKRRGTSDDNLYMLDHHVESHTELPKIYMAIGAQDPGAQDGYEAMDYMKRLGVDLYEVRDQGMHNWEYCARHVEAFLNWIPLRRDYTMEEQ